MSGQLEECYNSKVMESVLNGRTFKYHFGGGRLYMIPQSYEFSRGLCLNNFPQVLFAGNQRDQVTHPDISIGRIRCIVWLELGN